MRHFSIQGVCRSAKIVMCWCAMMAMAASSAVAQQTPLENLNIGSFTGDLEGWIYYGGWEFQGAIGQFARNATEGHAAAGSAELSGDFSKGGSYVAMKRECNIEARSVSFWIKAKGLAEFSVRLTDASGQTFQRKVKLAPGEKWQQVELKNLAESQGHYGGANDGAWHGPLTTIWVMLTAQSDRSGGTLWLDDVQVVREKQVWVAPAAAPAHVQPPADSIFGFSSHMMHTDFFYGPGRFGPYWGLEYTLPFVVDGGFGWMREAVYQDYFTGNDATVGARRAKIEQYIGMYEKAGVKVVLCPLFSTVENQNFEPYFQWLGDLCARHPGIAAVEMHNEPNLRWFWGGTEKDYAEACKRGAAMIKAKSPNTSIVIGSISHLWWGPGVQWLGRVMKYDAMSAADGISTHPYRNGAAPEGGSMHADPKDPQGLESELRDFYGMIQQWNPTHKPLKLYLTEVGYSTGRDAADNGTEVPSLDRQADYISRLALVLFDVRLRGVPIETINWYDLKCDGNDGSREANFGTIAYDTSHVRPSFQAYSSVAKTFGNARDFAPLNIKPRFSQRADVIKSFIWRRFSDDALIVAFWRLNQLQDADENFTSRLQLALPNGFAVRSVTLTDLYETTPRPADYTADNGVLAVPVKVSARASWLVIQPAKPQPVKPAGDWHWTLPARMDAGKAHLELRGPLQLKLGDNAPLQLVIDNSAAATALTGEIVLMCQPTAFNVPAGRRQIIALPMTSLDAAGSQAVHYHVRVGGAMVGRGGFVRVTDDPISLMAPPVINKAGELLVRLANAGKQPAIAIGASWSSADRKGQVKLQTAIAPDQSTVLTIAALAAKPYATLPLQATVAFDDRPDLSFAGDAGYNPCYRITPTIDANLTDWQTRAAIDLAADGTVHMEGYNGPADLGGNLWIGYDDTNFYLAARITDDKFDQRNTIADSWQADGLQFVLAAGNALQTDDWYELGLALTPNGAELWRWIGPEGTKDGPMKGRCVVRNDGNITTYECAIPWTELAPLSPRDGLLRFTVLVNDSDGGPRKGWIEWGSGIGADKRSSLFRICQFVE